MRKTFYRQCWGSTSETLEVISFQMAVLMHSHVKSFHKTSCKRSWRCRPTSETTFRIFFRTCSFPQTIPFKQRCHKFTTWPSSKRQMQRINMTLCVQVAFLTSLTASTWRLRQCWTTLIRLKVARVTVSKDSNPDLTIRKVVVFRMPRWRVEEGHHEVEDLMRMAVAWTIKAIGEVHSPYLFTK